MSRTRTLLSRVTWGLAMVALTLGGPGLDQTAGAAAQSRGRDFLFSSPKATLTFKAGLNLPRAASGNGEQSLWDLTREELTVENSDLAATFLSGEIAVRATERVDATISLGYSVSRTRSEFRDWVGTDDLPIEQVTEFSTTPFTLGAKAYLLDRGRLVGSLAWIPRAWNAYVGAAGGFVKYRFEQYGEFVDYETYDIFSDNFRSDGRAPTVHLLSGLEFGVTRNVLVNAEARYGFASAELDSDFVGFPDLDLAGFQVTGGISLRW